VARNLPRFFAQLRQNGVKSFHQFADSSFTVELFPVRSTQVAEPTENRPVDSQPYVSELDPVADLELAYDNATERGTD
jgi:hypothetical protein